MKLAILIFLFSFSMNSFSKSFLVKFDQNIKSNFFLNLLQDNGLSIKQFKYLPWVRVEQKSNEKSVSNLKMFLESIPGVAYVQPDYPVSLLNDYKIKDSKIRKMVEEKIKTSPFPIPSGQKATDNPPIPPLSDERGSGNDPDFDKQWGMKDIGVKKAWSKTRGSKDIIVAVLDTGVDYT
ncbi:MAG: hypothetical protein VYD54_07440, partial [Bdellovibrionota bacterium]|nr:hypothetical protein [Bdellovibrionota bacterium]